MFLFLHCVQLCCVLQYRVDLIQLSFSFSSSNIRMNEKKLFNKISTAIFVLIYLAMWTEMFLNDCKFPKMRSKKKIRSLHIFGVELLHLSKCHYYIEKKEKHLWMPSGRTLTTQPMADIYTSEWLRTKNQLQSLPCNMNLVFTHFFAPILLKKNRIIYSQVRMKFACNFFFASDLQFWAARLKLLSWAHSVWVEKFEIASNCCTNKKDFNIGSKLPVCIRLFSRWNSITWEKNKICRILIVIFCFLTSELSNGRIWEKGKIFDEPSNHPKFWLLFPFISRNNLHKNLDFCKWIFY